MILKTLNPPQGFTCTQRMLRVARYAMREALQIVGEVGLEDMWARHKRLHEDMWAGLQQLGLEPFVEDPADRLVTVNTIKVVA